MKGMILSVYFICAPLLMGEVVCGQELTEVGDRLYFREMNQTVGGDSVLSVGLGREEFLVDRRANRIASGGVVDEGFPFLWTGEPYGFAYLDSLEVDCDGANGLAKVLVPRAMVVFDGQHGVRAFEATWPEAKVPVPFYRNLRKLPDRLGIVPTVAMSSPKLSIDDLICRIAGMVPSFEQVSSVTGRYVQYHREYVDLADPSRKSIIKLMRGWVLEVGSQQLGVGMEKYTRLFIVVDDDDSRDVFFVNAP